MFHIVLRMYHTPKKQTKETKETLQTLITKETRIFADAGFYTCKVLIITYVKVLVYQRGLFRAKVR